MDEDTLQENLSGDVKRRGKLNLYQVRTRCGSYGGYCIAFAYSPQEALDLTNELLVDAPCRDEIGLHRVTLLYEDVKKLQPFACQVWDGNV